MGLRYHGMAAVSGTDMSPYRDTPVTGPGLSLWLLADAGRRPHKWQSFCSFFNLAKVNQWWWRASKQWGYYRYGIQGIYLCIMYGLWGKSDPAIRGVEMEKKDVEPGTVQSYCLFSTKHVFNFPVIDTTKYEIRKDPGPFSSGFGCHCKNTLHSNFVEKCFSKNVDIFFLNRHIFRKSVNYLTKAKQPIPQ